MRKFFIVSAASALLLGAGSAAAECYESFPAGDDISDETFVQGTLDFNQDGIPDAPFFALGPMTVKRGTPFDPGDGKCKIITEIISMALVGKFDDAIGIQKDFTMRTQPGERSIGEIKQQYSGTNFPANSSFNMLIQMEFPFFQITEVVFNKTAAKISASINSIPPIVEYGEATVKLTSKLTGLPYADLLNVTHDPFFD